MLCRIFISIFITTVVATTSAQVPETTILRLKRELAAETTDSVKLRLIFDIANGYRFSNVAGSLEYCERGIDMARRTGDKIMEAKLLSLKGATLLESGRLPESLQSQFETLTLSEELNDSSSRAYALNRIGNIYMELAEYRKANDYYFRSRELFGLIRDSGLYFNEVSNIGNVYELMGNADSAFYYQEQVYQAAFRIHDRFSITRPEMMFRMGNAYRLAGKREKALEFYKKGIVESFIDNDIRNLTMNNLQLAKLYKEMNQPDSSRKYAYDAIRTGEAVIFRKGVQEASLVLSDLYKANGQYDSAYKYLLRSGIEKDSVTGASKFQEMQRILTDEQEQQREREIKDIAQRNRQRQYALIGGLAVFLIIAFILYRNNKHKQVINKKLEHTLANLRATQTQLVHAEKMASLGELTAGIAHEIQNPLNFINNFSEVSNELADEMISALKQNNHAEAIAIAGDIKQNLVKVVHHGKRADGIVKGMLQHSRSGTHTKEPTDINKLCEEYLRLAYHGLRARDKTFNASMHTDLDESLPKVNIIPEDIGRVILNLITNAFYACMDAKKTAPAGYEPKVTVSTFRLDGKIGICVKDNGTGIPAHVIDKIFQPFFTTKPTGQGTGLGLSLSYDIVTKGHQGELKVETKEGEGSNFTIILPIK